MFPTAAGDEILMVIDSFSVRVEGFSVGVEGFALGQTFPLVIAPTFWGYTFPH